MKHKQCGRCRRKLSLSKFHKNKAQKSGLHGQCKQCRKKYQQTPRGKVVKIRCEKKYYRTLRGHLRLRFDSIKQRYTNSKSKDYRNHRIKIRCTFNEFCHHITVTLGYDTISKLKGLKINRIDTKGHYEVSNLHIVTKNKIAQNQQKARSYCGRPCSSRFKGVSWAKQKKKWAVSITADEERHHLGYFTNEIKAALVYDRASLKYHGESGVTNESLGLLN